MKKILLVMAVLLSMSVLLISCSDDKDTEETTATTTAIETESETETEPETEPPYLGFEGLYETDHENDWTPAKEPALVTDLTGLEMKNSVGDLLLFVHPSEDDYSINKPLPGEPKLAIFNTATGKTVYTLPQEDPMATIIRTASITSLNGYAVISETVTDSSTTSTNKFTFTYYSALGTKIVSKAGRMNAPLTSSSLSNDLVEINNTVYSVEDDVWTEMFTLGMKEIPQCDYITDKYNYQILSDGFRVYNKDYKLIAVVHGDSNADNTYRILSNGNILIQSTYELNEEAEEYDIIENGHNKYNLSNSIYNIETGETTEIELDYFIDVLANEYSNEDVDDLFIDGKLQNIAIIYPIVDKTVNTADTNMLIVNLDNDMKITGYLAQEIDNQSSLVSLVDDNRFAVSDMSGRTYLINQKGSVIGEISDGSAMSGALSGLLKRNGRVYSTTDLALVADISNLQNVERNLYSNTYKVPDPEYTDTLVLKNQTEYYILTNKGLSDALSIGTKDSSRISTRYANGLYIITAEVKNENDEWDVTTYFFDESGKLVYSYVNNVTSVLNADMTETSTSKYIDNITSVSNGIMFEIVTRVRVYDEYGFTSQTTTTSQIYFCQTN